jgi:serine/threonine-protein kinase
VELTPDNPQWLAQLGQARAVTGDTAGARAVLEQLQERARTSYVSPYHQAFVHVGLGEYERALDLLEKASGQRAAAVYGMKGSFLFTPLRGHPRFESLLQQIYSKRGS